MIDKQFLESLSPVEIQMIHQYIGILFREKISDDTSNHDNLKHTADRCQHCGSERFVKNGHNRKIGRQRYVCRDCKRSFEDSSGTFFFHSRIGYSVWMTFIGCEIVGLPLRQEEAICGVSKTTCFNMRHRLYSALSGYQDRRKLQGECQIDCAYTSINLKGWKKGMPRFSKKRGKHKPDRNHKQLRAISRHKICLLTSIDENDHILFKIAGPGVEDTAKYERFRPFFSRKAGFICDEKRCIESFARKHRFPLDIIPSGAFVSERGNSLSSVNQFHQEFAELIRKKHGIGTRHLQSYMDILRTPLSFTTEEICRLPMPVDVYEVYREYGCINPESTQKSDKYFISKNSSDKFASNQLIS